MWNGHGRRAVRVVMLSAACGLAAAPVGTQDAAPTAILAGQAVDAVTGAPVANTLIGLSQRARSGPNTTPTAPNTQLVVVMADSRGRFVVRDVPPGSFLLLATAPGYIVSNYGQARAAGPTRTLDLTGQERLVDLKVLLWRHAVIAGQVVDEAGEPVVGVTVRVLRRAANGAGGRERYQQGTQTTTDDRGRYRLTALTPGRFLVTVPQTQITVPAAIVDDYLQSAASRSGEGAGGDLLDLMNSASAVPSAGGGVRVDDLLLQASGNGRPMTVPPPTAAGLLVYPTTIFSGGTRGLPEIVVGPGEERSGVTLTLRPERAHRISGVVTADGAPVAHVVVRLLRDGAPDVQIQNGYEAAATVTAADGSFTLLGVTPGHYVLKVLRTPRLTLPPSLSANPAVTAAYTPRGAAQPAVNAPLIGAQVPIAVADADRTGLEVALRTGGTVSGRVVFTGTAPTAQQMRGFALLLGSEDGGLPGAGLQLTRFSATGDFTATAPAPGRYLPTVIGPPAAGWRLAGITLDGQPLSAPLDLGGDDISGLVLTFTDETGAVGGTLRRTDGRPVSTASIVVFPTDRTAWTDDPLNVRGPRLEQSQREGRFAVSGLLPGEYFVAALEDAERPDVVDLAFLETVARSAVRVRVAAHQRAAVDLTIGRLR